MDAMCVDDDKVVIGRAGGQGTTLSGLVAKLDPQSEGLESDLVEVVPIPKLKLMSQ
jgi:hypothetical protein